jgi:tRNA pseudouridine55 synthase
MNLISGILLIDKPEGITSFGVVRRVRRVLGVRKVGHLGTLDPFATGLLPLCLGEATKLAPFLMPEPKTYRAVVKLGEETDTQDLTGKVVATCQKLPMPEEVYEAAARFLGEIEQVPPLYSALHHEGERLYRLARRGETVAVKPRRVTIHRLEVEEVGLPLVTIIVQCSQGTYIRTLAADLGTALGCGGHLVALRRVAVGAFKVEAALPPTALEAMGPREVEARVIPLTECLAGMAPVRLDRGQAERLRQGQALPWPDNEGPEGEPVKVLAAAELVAVARVQRRGEKVWLTPLRVFAQRPAVCQQ